MATKKNWEQTSKQTFIGCKSRYQGRTFTCLYLRTPNYVSDAVEYLNVSQFFPLTTLHGKIKFLENYIFSLIDG